MNFSMENMFFVKKNIIHRDKQQWQVYFEFFFETQRSMGWRNTKNYAVNHENSRSNLNVSWCKPKLIFRGHTFWKVIGFYAFLDRGDVPTHAAIFIFL